MRLGDLRKSVSELGDGERINLVMSLREKRKLASLMIPPRRSKFVNVSIPRTSRPKKDKLDSLTSAQAAKLLAELTARQKKGMS
jgi:hypothetical protein